MITRIAFVSIMFTTVYTAKKYYNEIQEADKKIRNMLIEPMFRNGDKLICDIDDVNFKLLDLVKDLHNGTASGIRNSKYLYRKGEPKFVGYRFDGFILKTKFGWSEDDLRQLIKLREKTRQIFKYFCQSVERLGIFHAKSREVLFQITSFSSIEKCLIYISLKEPGEMKLLKAYYVVFLIVKCLNGQKNILVEFQDLDKKITKMLEDPSFQDISESMHFMNLYCIEMSNLSLKLDNDLADQNAIDEMIKLYKQGRPKFIDLTFNEAELKRFLHVKDDMITKFKVLQSDARMVWDEFVTSLIKKSDKPI